MGMTTWNFGEIFTCSIFPAIDREIVIRNLARSPVAHGGGRWPSIPQPWNRLATGARWLPPAPGPPRIVIGNLDAPPIMIAEKIVDTIRGRDPLPPSSSSTGPRAAPVR